MHVNARRLTRGVRPAGFSLLEVTIATSLLLLTVTSVTAAVTSISHAGRRAETATRVDGTLEAVVARLSGLPFCAATLPSSPAGSGATATDLLAAVFPDAGASRDTTDARYVAADQDGILAGSFVSRFDQDGARVTCVARFRDRPTGSWLGPADLTGWDITVSVRPPAPMIVVNVSVAAGGVLRTARLAREAGGDTLPCPQSTPPVGS
jgi:hypothetical protein